MLTLYVKTGCPYCALVLSKVEELGLTIEEKNIADDAVAAELVERGGKRMVPYLVDSEKNTEMYESSDIAQYLQEHYGGGEGGGQKHEHPDGGVCEACE